MTSCRWPAINHKEGGVRPSSGSSHLHRPPECAHSPWIDIDGWIDRTWATKCKQHMCVINVGRNVVSNMTLTLSTRQLLIML